jgi:outer membrane biosynthesis protein TonB
MRTSTAYFAGAGTVIVAIAAGLGGGLLMGNIVSSKTPPQEMTRLEQRIASQRSQAAPTAEPAQPAPAPGQTIAANTTPPSPTPPQPDPRTASPPKTEPANVPAPPPAQAAAVTPASTAAAAAEPSQPEVRRQTIRALEDSMARARDADLRRAERRLERSQRWTERRRYRQDRDLREVEQAVRDDTEQPRRTFAAEPVRGGMPVIKLFGEE